jgi:hypothetical protein
VKLTDYSLDDLHAMATAEVQDDDVALELLNTLYSDLRHAYLTAYLRLREVREATA